MRSVVVLFVLFANTAFAGITYCKAINDEAGQCYWCDCEGGNCQASNEYQCAGLIGGPPSWCYEPSFSISGCTNTCATPNEACGVPNNVCDSPVCIAAPGGPPTWNNTTHELENLPTCVHRFACGGGGSIGGKNPGSAACRPPGFGPQGGSKEIGDPIKADTRDTTHSVIDVDVPTSIGRFQLIRYFTSSPTMLEELSTMGPAPFGKRADTNTMHWTHSLNSYVKQFPG